MAKMGWKGVTVLLSAYGFLKEIRVSEPFMTLIFTAPEKNFTAEQVNQEIFPVSTYSMLALLVGIFLVTDWLRYKPVIVAQAVAASTVYAVITWGHGIPLMQAMEVLYGFMWAADVAYFTYMYAMVDREHYALVSAVARAAYLMGRFLSGVISQVTISTGALSYASLNYITFGALLGATLIAVALPSASKSLYFHRDQEKQVNASTGEYVLSVTSGANETTASGRSVDARPAEEARNKKGELRRVAGCLWDDFRDAYTNPYVTKWSAWWALATCGQMQVLNYVQVLWVETLKDQGSDEHPLNGAVEAVYTLLGAGAAWIATRKTNYHLWGDALLAAWSLAAGGMILLAASSRDIILQYVLYTLFGVIYHGAVTIASSEVAQQIHDDSHGLVFGINNLAALVFQTILTVAVAAEGGFMLTIRQQFTVYGAYFLLLGVSFVAVLAWSLTSKYCRRKQQQAMTS